MTERQPCKCCGSSLGHPRHGYCPRNECQLVAAGMISRRSGRARLRARGYTVRGR